jgi:hypothetical protein
MISSSPRAQGSAATALSPWRSAGIWMSAILIGYILFNALRSTLDPVGFASYYGLPLGGDGNDAFVLVYAIRALFLGLFGLALLVSRSYRALALFALIGSVMPIGDAILVAATGGGTGTVIRHSLTAVFLLITGYFVQRWAKRAAAM